MSELAERLDSARENILRTDTKILTIDIERLPGLARIWEPKTRFVAARNFVEWPRMLCFAARWYGDRSYVFEAEWLDRERMVQKAWELYNEADIVVTFNGVRFDNGHLRSEWLEAEMTPPSPWRDLDLYQQVKKFGFESKSLDSVTRRLGRPGKQLHYDMDLAYAAVEGNREAQAQIEEYNLGDIELTEWLHDRLIGWMPNAPSKGTFGEEKACNQCGGQDLKIHPDKKYRAVLLDYALYSCNDCGGWTRAGWVARAATTRGVK